MKRGPDLTDWIPVNAGWEDGDYFVEWLRLGSEPLDPASFEATARRCERTPFNRLFRTRTPISVLSERARAAGRAEPSGFIFHMSRCGSTLAAKMLAALSGATVISEAAPIDAILQAHIGEPELGEDRQAEWLAWMIAVLGRSSHRGAHFFVKFDSWHTRALPLIRRAFPSVPWIFLTRRPVEVLVSHMRQPGAQVVPGRIGESLLGIGLSEQLKMPREEHAARVLGRICEGALENWGPHALVIDYEEIHAGLPDSLLEHFKLRPAAVERRRMNEVAQHDAKNAGLPFTPDGAIKRAAATAAERAAAERWIEPACLRLASLRAGR